jgi:hypothetical protein
MNAMPASSNIRCNRALQAGAVSTSTVYRMQTRYSVNKPVTGLRLMGHHDDAVLRCSGMKP